MKVKELIKILKEFDQEKDVIGVYLDHYEEIPFVENVETVSDNNGHAQLNLTSVIE
jgi:hypothetical protein